MDHVREAAYLVDRNSRFCYVNEESCRVLGYSLDELMHLRVSDIDPGYPMKRWSEHWVDLRENQSLTFESTHRTKDGRLFSERFDDEAREFKHAHIVS